VHAARRVAPWILAVVAASCSQGGGNAGGTPSATWSTPVYFPPPQGFSLVASDVRVAVSSTGSGMLLWSRSYNTGATEYLYSRYTPGSGWSAPVVFAPGVSVSAMPELGMQGNGEAVLAWYGGSGSGSIYVARAAPGSDFIVGAIVTVDSTASGLRLHVRESGEAVLGWTKNDAAGSGPLRAWAAVYAPGVGWSVAAPVENASSAVTSGSLRVAADGTGGAIAVWTEQDPGAAAVWASRYVASSGWGPPHLLDTSAYSAAQPEIAEAKDGRALAAWMQPDASGMLSQVYTSRFEPGSGWATPQLLMSSPSATSYSFPYPRVAMNDTGEGLAVWRELVRANLDFAAYGSRSPPGGASETPFLLDGALGLYGPTNTLDTGLSAALSASGSGMAMWGGGQQVYACALGVGGWGSRIQLSSAQRVAYGPKMAMNAGGQGIAAWGEILSGTIEQVVVSVFSVP